MEALPVVRPAVSTSRRVFLFGFRNAELGWSLGLGTRTSNLGFRAHPVAAGVLSDGNRRFSELQMAVRRKCLDSWIVG